MDQMPNERLSAGVGDDWYPGTISNSAGARRLALVGASFRSAPVELRERLAVGTNELGALTVRMAGDGEAIVLATCARTEVYLASGDRSGAPARARAVPASRAGLAAGDLKDALYTVEDEAVVLHLFRVAAGLESLVPGESQILGELGEDGA
jgi:glutamyl-tRNA reductase